MQKKLIYIISFIALCVIILNFSHTLSSNNIMTHWEDGTNDPESMDIFKDVIDDANLYATVKEVKIWYYNCDLNDDGYLDKITIASNFIIVGTAGEPMEIWINDSNGHFINAGCIYARFINRETGKMVQDKKIYISNNKTNGFNDLEFILPENRLEMKYDSGTKCYDYVKD